MPSTLRIPMMSHQFATLPKYCDVGGVLRYSDTIRVHSGGLLVTRMLG
jgi:hypothetical protein